MSEEGAVWLALRTYGRDQAILPARVVVGPFDTDMQAQIWWADVGRLAYHTYDQVSVMSPREYAR